MAARLLLMALMYFVVPKSQQPQCQKAPPATLLLLVLSSLALKPIPLLLPDCMPNSERSR